MKRELSDLEKSNLSVIRDFATDIAFLYLTPTGIKKALLDAVLPVRTLLSTQNIHSYDSQAQGPENKVEIPAMVLNDNSIVKTRASLYRPITKKGDPRIWFSCLGQHASPNEVLALFVYEGSLHVVNLSRCSFSGLRAMNRRTETLEYFAHMTDSVNATAMELLGCLRKLAQAGPIPAVCKGDTAIGRTIENSLGLQINSSKDPDYKGIEIKSARGKSLHSSRQNRAVLFAQVADWSISRYKSSSSLLDAFGYYKNGIHKLYCTVAIGKPNSQGLQLKLLHDTGQLAEIHTESRPQDVVAWELDNLHKRLNHKHRETFWIIADTVVAHGAECFVLKSVRHTKNPSSSQFDRLLEDGYITVDHLIKRNPLGCVSEKGPLFKLPKEKIPELFLSKTQCYSL